MGCDQILPGRIPLVCRNETEKHTAALRGGGMNGGNGNKQVKKTPEMGKAK
jgi:hypothetical protein